jgi:hypothetical protein
MKKKALNALQENLRKDFVMRELINNSIKERPYVDPVTGMVFWGQDSGKRRKNAGV